MYGSLVVIEVADEPIIEGRPFTNKTTGLPGVIPGKQNIYIHQGERYPLKSELPFDNQTGPRRPGFYLLAGKVLELKGNQSGYVRLAFNDRGLDLVPVEEAAKLLANGGLTVVTGQGETLVAKQRA